MSVKILNFPKITDPRGNLTFIQNPTHIPFEIKRVFWSLNQFKNKIQAGSASEKGQEVIVALKGSFDVVVTNTNGTVQKFHLNSPHQALYLPALSWRHIENLSVGAIGFHLCSLKDSSGDQIDNFETFKNRIAK